MPEIFPLGHVGHFMIGTGAPGAPSLSVFLTVLHNSSTVTGCGLLINPSTHPELHANNAFHGVVHVLVFGGSTTQVYSLQGTAVPSLLGAPHVTHLLITLKGIWGTEGSATYTYVQGDRFHEVKEVPVRVRWLLQE
jgi:Domain of unknown function (DUF1842)